MTVEESKFEKATGRGLGPDGMSLLDYYIGVIASKPYGQAGDVTDAARKLMLARNAAHDAIRAEIAAASKGK